MGRVVALGEARPPREDHLRGPVGRRRRGLRLGRQQGDRRRAHDADPEPRGRAHQVKLDFVQPMAGTSTAEFTFKPEGDRTAVTWAMFGQNNFVARAICLFMNQDKMLGGYFEKGLENLKAVTEAAVRG